MTLAAALLHCVAHGNGLDCRPTTSALIGFLLVWLVLIFSIVVMGR